MALSVVGAGFGRTGTMSLKYGLELAGVGPCYHMIEVENGDGHAALWDKAASGGPIDWAHLFTGYAATVDWPGCYFWRELTEFYPEAKVILTVRDPEKWYASVRDTIYRAMMGEFGTSGGPVSDVRAMARKIILLQTFQERFEDKEYAIGVFNAHYDAVRAAIPGPRLLEYEVGEGWDRLCNFLNLEIPDADFPRVNSRDDFLDRFGKQ